MAFWTGNLLLDLSKYSEFFRNINNRFSDKLNCKRKPQKAHPNTISCNLFKCDTTELVLSNSATTEYLIITTLNSTSTSKRYTCYATIWHYSLKTPNDLINLTPTWDMFRSCIIQKRGAQLVVLEGKRRQVWENTWSDSCLDLHLMSSSAARAMVHAWLLNICSIVYEGHELPSLMR